MKKKKNEQSKKAFKLAKIINVKNAEGDADTTAEILIQNKIDYTPKVSVIIPVYNVEQYLRRCLDSVVNQTLKEIEIICVDDGSTDSSLGILQEYATTDKRISVLKQQNLHAGVARNAGLTVARGDYLSFLDSDDFFEPEMLEKMYKKAVRNNADFCICHVKILNSSTCSLENCNYGLKDQYLPSKEAFSASDIYDKIFQVNQGWVWDKIYNRQFVTRSGIRFQATRTANDVYFNFCHLSIAKSIVVCPEHFVVHRLNVKNSLQSSREKSYFNICRAVTHIKKFLERNNLYSHVQTSFVNYAISNIIWNYNTIKDPAKTFLLSYIHQFYTDIYSSISKDCYFNSEIPEKFEEILEMPYIKNIKSCIPVIFATNNSYFVPCLVAIKSLIHHANPKKNYAIFVLHSNLSQENIEMLEQLNLPNILVKTVRTDIEKLISQRSLYTCAHYSQEMYYRLLIPELFNNFTKVIYLDCDIVLTRDIAELYNTKIGHNILGAVINPVFQSKDYVENTLNVPQEKYFNSGVLIINNEKFKKVHILEKCMELLSKYDKLRYPDQDLLNMACLGNVYYLNPKWNFQWFLRIQHINFPEYCCYEYLTAEKEPYIIHYSSNIKPWKQDNLQWAKFWWQYALQTRLFNHADYLRKWYVRVTGKELNLDNPQTFNEKIQWLKLYDSTPIKTRLTDKYLVRDWIKEKIGEEYLIPLLGVYDKFEDINFDKLPNQFVIKCNHGSGWNIIVKDKSMLDLEEVKFKLDRWMNENFAFQAGLELHYRDIKPKIIIEKYITNNGTALYDYKFWCFNGKVEYMQFRDDYSQDLKMVFYNMQWKKQDFFYDHSLYDKDLEKPDNFDNMCQLAQKLCKDFAFVCVDLYRLNDGTIKFGEMTFTRSSGTGRWNNEKYNLMLGQKITLPKLAYNIDTGEYYELPKDLHKESPIATSDIKPRITSQSKKYILSYNLFGFLPLFTYKHRGGKEVWKILGIPIWKVRKMENSMVKKYYFLNLLILKMVGRKETIKSFK